MTDPIIREPDQIRQGAAGKLRVVEVTVLAAAAPYPATAKPVFVGHYWLSAERPEILTDNVACLDFSVAKGGFLCAYRWSGEQQLSNDNFVWVKGGSGNS